MLSLTDNIIFRGELIVYKSYIFCVKGPGPVQKESLHDVMLPVKVRNESDRLLFESRALQKSGPPCYGNWHNF